MVGWLAFLVVVFAYYFFWWKSSCSDDTWKAYRQRHRERRQMGPMETDINPDFQFNRPPPEKNDPA